MQLNISLKTRWSIRILMHEKVNILNKNYHDGILTSRCMSICRYFAFFSSGEPLLILTACYRKGTAIQTLVSHFRGLSLEAAYSLTGYRNSFRWKFSTDYWSKTKIVIFKCKNKSLDSQITIKINNDIIKQVPSVKFLGVTLDQKLTWTNHINSVLKSITKSTGMIAKLRHYTNKNTLKLIYYALVYPYLTYGNLIWGNTYPTSGVTHIG